MSYNIVLYSRLSSEDTNLNDVKFESSSITNQNNLLINYVKSKEEFKNANIIQMQDDGYSGATLQRPAMQKVLEMVENREVNCIIVKDLSRFLRNDLETIYYLDEVFPLYDVRIISIAEKFDTDNNKGKTSNIDIIFRSIANRLYIEELSKKTIQSRKLKILKGEFVQAVAPFGYEKSIEIKNQLVIQEECAEIVRYIFSLYLKNIGTREIAYKLNEENIPTCSQLRSKLMKKDRNWNRASKNNKWCGEKIRTILKDEVYIGNIVYGKTSRIEIGNKKVVKNNPDTFLRYENAHQPIISTRDFNKVQKKITDVNKMNKKNYTIYLFTNKLKCKKCNRQLKRYKRSNGTYYDCTTKTQDRKHECISNKIFEAEISDAVLNAIKLKMEENQVEIDNVTPKVERIKKDISKCEKNILNKKSILDTIKEKGMKLYDNYKDEILEKEEFLIKKTELNSKKNDIEEEINKLNLKINSLESDYKLIKNDNNKNTGNIIDETLTRELVEEYIECIYVNLDLTLEIVFKK